MAETGTYVYAVSRAFDPALLSGLTGVSEAPVRTVERAGLGALVSTVSLAEFGEEALQNNLEDLEWLETTARAHHGVVEAAAGVAATAPLRLATLYHDDARVRELLEDQYDVFADALARIEGRAEWGVKAYADPDAFASGGEAQSSEPASPGMAYLQRRRGQRRGKEEAQQAAAGRAEDIHARLDNLAAGSRRHPPQDQRLAGHEGWMILNGAYLLDEDRVGDLRAAVAELEDQEGIQVELTGPWAPYSFAGLEEQP